MNLNERLGRQGVDSLVDDNDREKLCGAVDEETGWACLRGLTRLGHRDGFHEARNPRNQIEAVRWPVVDRARS